ncbi:MAG: zf-HC2 domain-containing protein [Marmoricola sp.]
MKFSLSGHIGSGVSALVDGQLPAGEEERAWSHVLTCPGCRALVEQEGWTKRQLGSLGSPVSAAPPGQLLGSLHAVDVVDAWAAVDAIERRSTRRRTVALVGGGAVGAAVLGLVAVTGADFGIGGRGGPPAGPAPASIRLDRSPLPAGSPTGVESNKTVAWVRRSR